MDMQGIVNFLYHEVNIWPIFMAAICGAGVGIVYFESLRWSVKKLSVSKHRISMFASVAACRIALFFGVLALIADRKISVILVYLLFFFITKMFIIWFEKKQIINDVAHSGGDHDQN